MGKVPGQWGEPGSAQAKKANELSSEGTACGNCQSAVAQGESGGQDGSLGH